jgi:transcriptional regulator with XRE-family HTH domain
MDGDPDPVMAVVRARFEKSGLSLDELGTKMGYPKDSARKSAWQFIQKTNDPRLSMLRKFAGAIGVKLTVLLKD